MNTQTYQVKGMHCASCSSIISKKLKKLTGVEACDVNFATEKAHISFDPEKTSLKEMNEQITPLGYELEDHASHEMQTKSHDMSGMMTDHSEHLGLTQSKEEKIKEPEALRNKVYFVLPITIIIFFFMMWDVVAKLVSFVPNLPIPMGLFNTLQFVLSSVVLFWIGKPYLEAVLRFVRFRVANMDALVGIGTLSAYLYSSLLFLLPPLRQILHLPEYTYFDVAIVVTGFITLGKYLESRSKLKTGEAIEKLLQLQAKTAWVIRGEKEIEVPVSDV